MPDSPLIGADLDLRVTISCNGTALAQDTEIVSIEITRAVNRVPSARIVLTDDSDVDKSLRFALSDADLLAPGAEVVVRAGYGAKDDAIFTGVVVRQGVRIGVAGKSRLVVDCYDKAVALTVGRRCANYVDKTDDAILKTLVESHGLEAAVTATKTTHKELVQYDVSDWDFLLARAEANGLVVVVDAGKVTVAPPQVSDPPALVVTYGHDLLEFDGEIDARAQLASVVGTAWDPSTQAVIEETAAPPALNKQGNLDSKTLAAVLGLPSYRMRSSVALDSTALQAWSAARQMRAGLARVRGRMRFCGSARAQPGALLAVAGAGKRFEGDTWLSAVTHMITPGVWTTEAEFGLRPETLAERGELSSPRAAGLTAGVSGLQIGVVSKLDEDPDAQYKVQVALPVTQAETAGVWARLATHYASEGVGHFFLPEIGDEVVLAFLNDDPSHPVIVGSLYSSKRKPPYEPAAANNTKAIVTRSKLKIEFDEEKKSITIATPGNNQIVLSDDAKSIELADQNGNKVTLAPGGITLDSPKDIAITAKGKITLDAAGNVTVTSKADLQQSAMNIKNEATAGFTAKGASNAELSASGQTVVKGAMVMIN